MQRLNPTQNVDDAVYMGFFPPSDDYYTDLLQDKSFENFLLSDGTTKDGQNRIADFYQVTELWKQMEKSECNYERYFQLLMLVKRTVQPIIYGSASLKDYIGMLQPF